MEANYSDGERFVLWKWMPSAPDDSCSAKTKDSCHRSPFGTMYVPLMDTLGTALLTWFLGASPARTYPQPEPATDLTAQGLDCGWKWRESSAKYDQASASWKTRQCSLLGGLEEFSGTWPRWGTMRNGECWERQTWERRTNGTDAGLLPTPLASIGTHGGPNQRDSSGRPGLQMAAQTWPTPTKSDGTGGPGCSGRAGGLNLRTAVTLPTPTVCGNYNRKGASPTSGDGLATVVGGQLNPTWVEWLMGWPLGWTDSRPLAMDRCHDAQQRLG